MSALVQILDEADCISHCAYTFGKGLIPASFSPVIGK